MTGQRHLTPGARDVLGAMAAHAATHGTPPTVADLCAATGRSQTRVRGLLRELFDAGAIRESSNRRGLVVAELSGPHLSVVR